MGFFPNKCKHGNCVVSFRTDKCPICEQAEQQAERTALLEKAVKAWMEFQKEVENPCPDIRYRMDLREQAVKASLEALHEKYPLAEPFKDLTEPSKPWKWKSGI